MGTIIFTGNVVSSNEQPINGADILLVNLQNRKHQYRSKTDASGDFTVDVAPGHYDVLINCNTYMPAINAGVDINEELTFDFQLGDAEQGQKRIIGNALLPDGSPAAGYNVELMNGDASVSLKKSSCNAEGSFEISDCDTGYHILRLHNDDGDSYSIAMPMPAESVSISIDLVENIAPENVFALAPASGALISSYFSVCKQPPPTSPANPTSNFVFTGSVMTAGGKSYMKTQGYPLPVALNVYTGTTHNPLYSYSIYVDQGTTNPFYTAPPMGQYFFYDATGDFYWLLAYWPMLHSVDYNSTSPDIVKVQINVFAYWGPGGYWDKAPNCQ